MKDPIHIHGTFDGRYVAGECDEAMHDPEHDCSSDWSDVTCNACLRALAKEYERLHGAVPAQHVGERLSVKPGNVPGLLERIEGLLGLEAELNERDEQLAQTMRERDEARNSATWLTRLHTEAVERATHAEVVAQRQKDTVASAIARCAILEVALRSIWDGECNTRARGIISDVLSDVLGEGRRRERP